MALAIAQNGSEEQHSKLALSGLLVPVSDLLRISLARGDLYKFSAALALVRFCGPYVAAGTRGGVQSVRDAIRVGTNVLTLPVNPDASVEQIETQESLKSECINALESLSKNSALWSAISTDALPSIVAYLHSSCDVGVSQISLPETRSSALRAVLQIVQVPSHAVAAAEAGLAEPLGLILNNNNLLRSRGQEVDESMQVFCMEVLHVLVARPESRRHCKLLQGNTLRSVCAAIIGFSVTHQTNYHGDGMSRLTHLGLEILLFALAEVEAASEGETSVFLQSAGAIAFLDAVASESSFIRSLCATLLLKTEMIIKSHNDEDADEMIDVPRLYGSPLLLVKKKCSGFDNTHDAAAAVLFATSVFACAIESHKSNSFWNCALLQDLHKVEVSECIRTSTTLCATYLRLLTEDYVGFEPHSSSGRSDYENLTRPLVRYRLLEAMKTSIDELTTESVLGHNEIDSYMLSALIHFNVPHLCLSVWKDPALLELSYGLIKTMVENDPDEVLHLFVESKEAIMSLFDLLNIDKATEALVEVNEIQRFLATTLEKLAQSGMLTDAVKAFDVRSSAIAALATACLSEQEVAANHDDDEEELTSNRLASGLMQTLVELCTVSNDIKDKRCIQLSPGEAEAIARSLGETICKMVMKRFIERARLQQYEIEEDENIMEAPDVAMLCAISQHDVALQVLRSVGGLHAIAQIAGEGEITAIRALQKGCKEDPSLLLEAETYSSILSLFSTKKEFSRDEIETAAFELLAHLCLNSTRGRTAVAGAPYIKVALDRALGIISKVIVCDDVNDEDEEKNEDKKKSVDEEENDKNTAQEKNDKNNQEMTKAFLDPTTAIIDDPKLLSASYSFLSTLTPVPHVRNALLDGKFIEASSALITNTDDSNLQFAALRAIAKLAPYSSVDTVLSADSIGNLLQSALAAEPTPSENGNFGGWNKNLYHVQAAEGILVIFDSLSLIKQECIFREVSTRYSKLLKSHCIARAASKNERENGGELAYNLTTLMMVAKGKDFDQNCFDSSLVTSLINTVQWRYDPKTSISEESREYWDAATTQCLQLLFQVFSKEEAALIEAGIKIRNLMNSAFMVARPGKAPRKAIDFLSALKLISQKGEATAKVSSQRILLFLDS